MTASPRIVVLGGGPTGLGAAWRMNELGHTNWDLYEASDGAGGLASSAIDDEGFTWDLGGHVLFSHYRYFDHICNTALGAAWVEHVREAWVWIRDRWVPYPFQNNLWRLPPDDVMKCVNGLVDTRDRRADAPNPASFDEWLLQSFGPGLCDLFMHPYNTKVWAYPPKQLDTGWVGERVATVDLKAVLAGIVHQRDQVGWGPNSTFRFPLTGGTGAIWSAVADRLPSERLHFGCRAKRVHMGENWIELHDGARVDYDWLISTIPLDRLLGSLVDPGPLTSHIDSFTHSSTNVVGIGIDGPVPDDLKTKCWLYFPDPDVPFYRATVFSNYSPNNVPSPGEQWSIMAEVSESSFRAVNQATVVEDTVEALVRCKLLHPEHQVVSRWHRRLEYGYPTPWLGRDSVLDTVHPTLEANGILSRGRFGAWKYEVSNQDHSLMQGVEAVGRILEGTDEYTFHGDMRDWLEPCGHVAIES